MKTKKLTMISMLLALSVVLNIIEGTIPLISNMIPGVKLGLANIVVLFAIYIFSFKEALYISIGRVFLVGLIRTGLFGMTFFFSLSGALLSTITMYLAKRYTKLSIIGVSVIGAITHSIGQILIAIIMLKTINVIFYLPYILLLSIPTGIIVGMIAKNVLSLYQAHA
jgi:heptaprenyl diphosphate synthase